MLEGNSRDTSAADSYLRDLASLRNKRQRPQLLFQQDDVHSNDNVESAGTHIDVLVCVILTHTHTCDYMYLNVCNKLESAGIRTCVCVRVQYIHIHMHMYAHVCTTILCLRVHTCVCACTIHTHAHAHIHVHTLVYDNLESAGMGWLRLVGSFKLYVSFAEYRLLYRAVLQKRPIILRSLLIEATPYDHSCLYI